MFRKVWLERPVSTRWNWSLCRPAPAWTGPSISTEGRAEVWRCRIFDNWAGSRRFSSGISFCPRLLNVTHLVIYKGHLETLVKINLLGSQLHDFVRTSENC